MTNGRVIAVIGVVLMLAGAFAIFRYVQGAVHIHTDFSNDYAAAQALRTGQSIYAVRNNHPPLTALVFLPLSFLPYGLAFVLWTMFSIALYGTLMVLVARTLDIHLAPSWQLLLFGVALLWYPFLAHVALGQSSLLLAACLILGWQALRQEREERAGLWFGVAAALKLFPGLVAVTLLARRRWRALGVMAAVTLGGLLGPLLIISPADLVRYFTEIAPQNAARYAVFPVNSSMSGLVSRLLVSGPWVAPIADAPTLASILIMGVSLFVVGWLFWQAWRLPKTTEGTDVMLGLTCVAMLLVSPITWQHSFTLLILPLGIVLKAWSRSPSPHLRRWGLLTFTLLALPDVELAQALMALSSPHRMPWWQSLALDGGAVALVVLGALLISVAPEIEDADVA